MQSTARQYNEATLPECSDAIVCNNILQTVFQQNYSITYKELSEILKSVYEEFTNTLDVEEIYSEKALREYHTPVSNNETINSYFREKDGIAYFIKCDGYPDDGKILCDIINRKVNEFIANKTNTLRKKNMFVTMILSILSKLSMPTATDNIVKRL